MCQIKLNLARQTPELARKYLVTECNHKHCKVYHCHKTTHGFSDIL